MNDENVNVVRLGMATRLMVVSLVIVVLTNKCRAFSLEKMFHER